MTLGIDNMDRVISHPLPEFFHVIKQNMGFHDEDNRWFMDPIKVLYVPLSLVTTSSPYIPGENGNV